MIVHVIKDGTPHYSVVREVTENSVRLADPSLGNIEMSREKFSEIFSGNVLVITVPQETNQTAKQVNTDAGNAITVPNMEAPDVSVNETSTNNTDVGEQPENSQILTAEEMQTIRGKCAGLSIAALIVAGMFVGAMVQRGVGRHYTRNQSSGSKRKVPPPRPRKKWVVSMEIVSNIIEMEMFGVAGIMGIVFGVILYILIGSYRIKYSQKIGFLQSLRYYIERERKMSTIVCLKKKY